MRFNIYNALMRKAYLFGVPVLHSGMPIPREEVPQGWYCYDLRGTDRAPHDPCSVVDHAENYHTGSVLSLLPLKSEGVKSRPLEDEFYPTQEFLSLEAFSAENHINAPEIPFRYQLRPATPEEAGLFYALPTEKDEELGTIGCLHIDYGLSGGEFNHTWCPRGPEELVTPAFKEELNRVVDDLRQGVLSDFSTMLRLCHIDGGEINGGGAAQNYGFVLETEGYRYCLRCSPARWECKAYLTVYDLWEQELNQTRGQEPEAGHCNPTPADYQAYLACFDKQGQRMGMAEQPPVGRVTFASGERLEFTDPEEYLQTVREELPFHATTGFRFENLTSDPEIRKAADDAIYHLFGEENPRELEDYQEPPDQGMTLGGM